MSNSDQPTVLILTQQLDPTADLVVTALLARGVTVVRCDIAEFPDQLTLAAQCDKNGRWDGLLTAQSWQVQLSDITAAYYRRPSRVEISDKYSETDRRWAATEAFAGFGGLLATMDNWLNHPSCIGYAEYKPVQLAEAVKAGLTIPETLITNHPTAAVQFAQRNMRDNKETLYKAFSSTIVDNEERQFIYANRVSPEQLSDPAISDTAHLFQEWIGKAYDVRLTVIDHQIFAVRIYTEDDRAKMDWRANYDSLHYLVTDVPIQIADSVHILLRTLKLRFAAIDFAVTHTGEWFFLDLNPNGQWSWIEHETGLPICAAITDALLKVP